MPLFHRTVFLGHDLALFLPDPNWLWSLEIAHRLIGEIETGQTGRENRRPKHYALRHEISATWTLPQAATAELQDVLWNLGTPAAGDRVYVGLPIFVDQLAPAQWAEKIYDAQWVINYDETGYSIHASDDLPEAPVRRWFAPLIVGRLQQRPKFTTLSDQRAQYQLRLFERSPWDFRIAPAAEVIGVDWPLALEANWKELPQDWTEDVLVYDDVGSGRVEALDGQDGNVRRAQSFLVTCKNRAQARALLNFFLARKGPVQSFTAPWLLQPGADLPQTPHSTKARFAEDVLRLVYTCTTNKTCEGKITMVQVPWELAGVAGEVPEQTPDAFFYKLWLDVPGGPVVWRFTNWEHDLIRGEFDPVEEAEIEVIYKGDVNALFQHDKISHAIDLSDDPVTIGSWIFDGNPLVRVVQRVLDVPLQIEILRGNPANPNAAAVVYSGEVLDADNEGRRLSASTAVLGGLLDVKVPNFFFGPVCNYQFCGPGCNTSGSMDPADWTFAGTIVSQVGGDLTIDVTSNPPAAALVDDYFAKAWIKSGAGDNYELRQIVRSVDLGGGQQKFKLKRPLRTVVVGAVTTFRPYCSGTRAECEVKFDNYINMGAHPHIGNRNLSVPSREVSTPTGKK